MAKNLIKVSTYAKMKNVSVQTVYKWVKEGKISTEKIDGVLFIIGDANDGNRASETA